MQLACPTCATCYEVGASAIGAAGRSVRCVRCRTVWQAAPAPADAAEAAARDDAVAAFRAELGDDAAADAAAVQPTIDVTDLPPNDELTAAGVQESAADTPESAADALPITDIETVAAASSVAEHPIDLDAGRPPIVIDETPAPDAAPLQDGAAAEVESLAVPRRRRGHRPPPQPASRRRLPAVIVGLGVLIGALIGWRGEVVRRAPQMASLYSAIGLPVNLRKMIFTDVHMTREIHDGVPVLQIQGMIVSTSSAPVQVPRLRFAVRNEAGTELYSWAATAAQPKLAPFEALPFQSRLASPPADAHDIVVRFFNRRDTVASLR